MLCVKRVPVCVAGERRLALFNQQYYYLIYEKDPKGNERARAVRGTGRDVEAGEENTKSTTYYSAVLCLFGCEAATSQMVNFILHVFINGNRQFSKLETYRIRGEEVRATSNETCLSLWQKMITVYLVSVIYENSMCLVFVVCTL